MVVVLEENLLLGEMFQVQEVLAQEHLEILLHNQQEEQAHPDKEILEEVKQVLDMEQVLVVVVVGLLDQMVIILVQAVLGVVLVVMVHHHLYQEHQ